jgi:peptide/nickel transport system substrate-binding protein
VPSMFLGALSAPTLKQDLAKAKSELKASGLDNPTVKLEYPSDISSNGLQFGTLAQKVKSDLTKVGINVELAGTPVATSLNTYRAGTEPLGLWYWGPDYPDPNDYLAFLPGQTVGLRAGWAKGADPSLEALATKAAETVGQDRAAVFQEIQRKLNTASPFVALMQPPSNLVAAKNLQGLQFNPTWTVDLAALRRG